MIEFFAMSPAYTVTQQQRPVEQKELPQGTQQNTNAEKTEKA